jgi:hypothetical protein
MLTGQTAEYDVATLNVKEKERQPMELAKQRGGPKNIKIKT